MLTRMNQTENKNFCVIGFNSIRKLFCSPSRLLSMLYSAKIGIRKAEITERTINLSLTWKKKREPQKKNVNEIATEKGKVTFYALPFSFKQLIASYKSQAFAF